MRSTRSKRELYPLLKSTASLRVALLLCLCGAEGGCKVQQGEGSTSDSAPAAWRAPVFQETFRWAEKSVGSGPPLEVWHVARWKLSFYRPEAEEIQVEGENIPVLLPIGHWEESWGNGSLKDAPEIGSGGLNRVSSGLFRKCYRTLNRAEFEKNPAGWASPALNAFCEDVAYWRAKRKPTGAIDRITPCDIESSEPMASSTEDEKAASRKRQLKVALGVGLDQSWVAQLEGPDHAADSVVVFEIEENAIYRFVLPEPVETAERQGSASPSFSVHRGLLLDHPFSCTRFQLKSSPQGR